MNSYSRLILLCSIPIFLLGCAAREYIAYEESARQYDPSKLSEDLKSNNKYIRQTAAMNATNLGKEEHIDLLINIASTDADSNVRTHALHSLGLIFNRTKDPRITDFLIHECKEVFETSSKRESRYKKTTYDRTILLFALCRTDLKAPEVIDCIFQFMTDEEEISYMRQYNEPYTNRAYAIQFAAGFGEGDIQPLINAVHSENSKISSGAIEALVKLGEKAVDPLIAELNTADIRIKTDVIDALGEIGNEKAIEPLSAFLSDEREDIRKLAADAIGKIKILSKVRM